MNLSEKIIKNLIEARLIKVTFRKIKLTAGKVRTFIDYGMSMPARYLLSKTSVVENNKIMFMTYNNDYICNPKYICEELLRQKLPVDIVWATTKEKLNSVQYPANVRLIIRGSYEFFKEQATSKVWIDNAVCFTWNPFPKKKEQFYLQTWHGSMGLKRIGTDDVKNRRWSFAAKLAGKWTDVCISNSSFESEVFRETHWPTTQIQELGHARNDILFSSPEAAAKIRKKVCDFFDIPVNKKIALYAPTFRDAQDTMRYSLDYPAILKNLKNKFGGEWVLLNRFHFKSKKAAKSSNYSKNIYPATEYPDMQELMVAADIGITDYSSWICDFVLTGKPGFIYAPDLNQYNQERGFYYPLNSTPFPVAETNDEMMTNILNFNMEKYSRQCEIFLAERGCKENGMAAKQIVEIIRQECQI